MYLHPFLLYIDCYIGVKIQSVLHHYHISCRNTPTFKSFEEKVETLKTKITPSTGDIEEVSESTPDGEPLAEQPDGTCPPDQITHWGSTLKSSPLLSPPDLLSPFFHSTAVLLHSHSELCSVVIIFHWSLGHLQTGRGSPTLEQMCQNVRCMFTHALSEHDITHSTAALTSDP